MFERRCGILSRMIKTELLETAKVADIMTTEFDHVNDDLPLRVAAGLIRNRRGSALVVDTGDDSPSIISEFNIVKAVEEHGDLSGRTVGQHLTRIAVAAAPDWPLGRALDTMLQGGFRHLIVVDDNELVGMMRLRDIFVRISDDSYHASPNQDTAELGALVTEDLSRVLQLYRKSAKQHWVAIKCPCQLDWLEIVVSQAEMRSDLTIDEIGLLWEQRQECPALHEGGAGD